MDVATYLEMTHHYLPAISLEGFKVDISRIEPFNMDFWPRWAYPFSRYPSDMGHNKWTLCS